MAALVVVAVVVELVSKLLIVFELIVLVATPALTLIPNKEVAPAVLTK